MEKQAILKDVSSSELRQELINRLKEQMKRNEQENEALRRQIQQLQPDVAVLRRARPDGTSRTLARNGQPLREVIIHVMREAGQPLRTRDIIQRVRSAGYQSKAANFQSVVNFALNNNESLFERVERGTYSLRPGAAIHANGEATEAVTAEAT